MTQAEQKIYDMIGEAYKRHGSELVAEKYFHLKTCEVNEKGDGIVITINIEVPYVNSWFAMMAEVEEELQNMGYELVKRKFMYDFFILTISK